MQGLGSPVRRIPCLPLEMRYEMHQPTADQRDKFIDYIENVSYHNNFLALSSAPNRKEQLIEHIFTAVTRLSLIHNPVLLAMHFPNEPHAMAISPRSSIFRIYTIHAND